VLLPGCLPPAPTPAANSDPPVHSSPQNAPSDACPVRRHESMQEVSNLEKKYRASRAGARDVGVKMIFSKALRSEASRQLLIRGSQPPNFTPPRPQPYQAWHGYRVTSAHHEEVGVSADGSASAPHPGVRGCRRCAAGGRRVSCTPYMNTCLRVNWFLMNIVYVFRNHKSASSAVARARGSPCLVACERVYETVSVFDTLFVCVSFEVGASEGCGVALHMRDECVWPYPRAYDGC
jgi:hypothetical protein